MFLQFCGLQFQYITFHCCQFTCSVSTDSTSDREPFGDSTDSTISSDTTGLRLFSGACTIYMFSFRLREHCDMVIAYTQQSFFFAQNVIFFANICRYKDVIANLLLQHRSLTEIINHSINQLFQDVTPKISRFPIQHYINCFFLVLQTLQLFSIPSITSSNSKLLLSNPIPWFQVFLGPKKSVASQFSEALSTY